MDTFLVLVEMIVSIHVICPNTSEYETLKILVRTITQPFPKTPLNRKPNVLSGPDQARFRGIPLYIYCFSTANRGREFYLGFLSNYVDYVNDSTLEGTSISRFLSLTYGEMASDGQDYSQISQRYKSINLVYFSLGWPS